MPISPLWRNNTRILLIIWKMKRRSWINWWRKKIIKCSIRGRNFREDRKKWKVLLKIETGKSDPLETRWIWPASPTTTRSAPSGKPSTNMLTKNRPSTTSISPISPSSTNKSPNWPHPTNSKTIKSRNCTNTTLFWKKITSNLSRIWSRNGNRKGRRGRIRGRRKEIAGRKWKKRKERISRSGRIRKGNLRWIFKNRRGRNISGLPTAKNLKNKMKDCTNRLDSSSRTAKVNSTRIRAPFWLEEAPKGHWWASCNAKKVTFKPSKGWKWTKSRKSMNLKLSDSTI